MCNLSDVIEEVAMKRGFEKGIEKGIEKGESLFGSLSVKLIEAGRDSDVILAAADEKARKRFYIEFGLLQEDKRIST